MQKRADPPVDSKAPVVIKKYANRRLYNTETSSYVTLDDLGEMVRAERDFVVFDAKTGDDLTRPVLTQIIVEQESRPGAQTMLPIPFLRQLIRFYGDSIQKMVPSYLQVSLETLVQEQERFRTQFATAFTPQGAIEAFHEQARKNIALFDQAMSMFAPFTPGVAGSEGKAATPPAAALPPGVTPLRPAAAAGAAPIATPPPSKDELAELKAQLASMQQKIEKLASGS